MDRFISAHAIVLSVEGIPAIYVNSLLGSKNYIEGVRMTNSNRTINRQKWNLNQIEEMMTSNSDQTRIFHSLIKLIEIRKKNKKPFILMQHLLLCNLAKNFWNLETKS